jgi:hypothetical protein
VHTVEQRQPSPREAHRQEERIVNQINRFDTAVSALYATVLESNQWSETIARIATYFDASTVCIFRYDARTLLIRSARVG